MHPPLVFRLVPPDQLAAGPVATSIRLYRATRKVAQVAIAIDETSETDVGLIGVLNDTSDRLHKRLASIYDPRKPPTIRFFLKDLNRMVDTDFSPEQVDIYVRYELMPQAVIDGLTSQFTYLVHTYPSFLLRSTDGRSRHQAL
ncbi:hypothetical protein [Streptosporangium sp. NPDC020145]|uniref:hypothetical protein n=1 Tax=Streptosporangium sp. NPDC020145 TaxID=3154694 RepID=UPI0034253BD5